ncbi:hypothetical protein FJTKL_04787 [Diaporthe vaccinii]|uniref:Transcription factor domain-containing protein n=1 Tax=Diaporthe vaccinii TaxID=105482 RepID=A0ABR4DSF9_9PEZI
MCVAVSLTDERLLDHDRRSLHNIHCRYVDRRNSLKRHIAPGISESSVRHPPLDNPDSARPPILPAYQSAPSYPFHVPGQVQPTVPLDGVSDGCQHIGTSNEDAERFYQSFAAINASGSMSGYALQQMGTTHNWGSLSYLSGAERFYDLPNWNNDGVGQELWSQGCHESNSSSIGAEFGSDTCRPQEDEPALDVLPTPVTEHDTAYPVSTNRNTLSACQQSDEGLEELTTVTYSLGEAPAVSNSEGNTQRIPDSSAPNNPSETASPSLPEDDNCEIDMADTNVLFTEHKQNPLSPLLQLFISIDFDKLYTATTEDSTGRFYARVGEAFQRLTATFRASLATEAKSAPKVAQGCGDAEWNPHIGDMLSSIPYETRKVYIVACYNGLYGFWVDFLVSRDDLESWVEDTAYHSICSSPTADPCRTISAISLLALGSLNTGSLMSLDSLSTGLNYRKSFDSDIQGDPEMGGKISNSSSAQHTGLDLFNLALVAYRHLGTTAQYLSSATFKALMAMSIFAQEAGHPIMNSLLVDAALLSHRLKLYSSAAVEAETPSSESHQREQLQGAFWLLYCLEKPFSLYSGHPSILNDEFIDYDPPNMPSPANLRRKNAEFQQLSNHQALHVQCEYAKICDKIAKDLFGQISLRNSTSRNIQTANQIIRLLNRWYEINVTESPSNIVQVDHPGRGLIFLLHTCKAKFVVYGRSLQLGFRQQGQCERNLAIYDRLENDCLDSARRLILCILNIRYDKIFFNNNDHRILNLVRIATLLIALSEARNSSIMDEGLRHISNACGVFGRIASVDATVLDELIELGQFTKTMTSLLSSNPQGK